MKRMIIACALLAVPFAASAQTDANMIERALAGAPANAREGAMVVKFNADGSYDVLKEGTNTWVCYDRSSDAGRPAYAVQCTSKANLGRLEQNRKFLAQAAGDRQALRALVSEAEANGTRIQAEFGSVWLASNGEDPAHAMTHVTVAVPGATAESLGVPDNGRAGGIWIMQGGTSEAHLMVPVPR